MKKLTKPLTEAQQEAGREKKRRFREKQRDRPLEVRRQNKVSAEDLAKVKRWASESASKGAIARRLGMDHKTFRALMEQDPDVKAAYDDGVEAEHQELVSALKRQLDRGPVPAIFLLKTRHGYREGDQSEQANRVSVTFNLPGALPLDAFNRSTVIEHDGGADGRDHA